MLHPNNLHTFDDLLPEDVREGMRAKDREPEGATGEASESLLNRVAELYQKSERDYRDNLLECGRLLHEYVLAYLHEGDGIYWKERVKRGLTHTKALGKAAAHLGTSKDRVSTLIGVSQVAHLLAGEQGVGSLCWQTISRFRIFITRHQLPDSKAKTVSSSVNAEWAIRREFVDRAKAVFQQAVREGLSQDNASDFLAPYLGPRKQKKPTRKDVDLIRRLVPLARIASPGDIAELLFEVVRESPSPQIVAARLADLCKTVRKRLEMADAC